MAYRPLFLKQDSGFFLNTEIILGSVTKVAVQALSLSVPLHH